MSGLGFDLCNEAKLTILTNDVVKSSAIEGEYLNEEEVRSSVAKRLGLEVAGLTENVGRDVDGVVELMLDATTNHDQKLTADRLFSWHASLFPSGRSGMNKITVGAWRPESSGEMKVVSGPMVLGGDETVHFVAPSPSRVEQEMDAFLEWFNSNNDMDPVLKAAVAHLWFLTVHPFQDGNGRIARAIADMALARADGMPERFYSMSTQIELERKDYYLQLEKQQRWTLDLSQWLDWFLGCLGRAIDNAQSTLENVHYKTRFWEQVNLQPVNDRQRLVLQKMLDNFKGHMNTSKYAKLTKTSNDSALRDIKGLLSRGVFVQNPGGGRSTSYRLVSHKELKSVTS